MTPAEFRVSRRRTMNHDLDYGSQLDNAALGLGEAGEVQNLIKKHLYHNHPLDDAMVAKILDELGDLFFYGDWIAELLNADLSAIFEINRDKLTARYPNGFSSADSINRTVGS